MDFGGEAGVAGYPSGYKHWLEDGYRVKISTKAGTPIQKWHDVYALGTPDSDGDFKRLEGKVLELPFCAESDCGIDSAASDLISEMVECLESKIIEPNHRFKDAMRAHDAEKKTSLTEKRTQRGYEGSPNDRGKKPAS
jgi:hypothetical protein